MASVKQQKQKPLPEVPQERSFETYELAPYAAHANNRSLLTKNVELIQCIKLSTNDHVSDDDFRKKVRASLNKHVDPSKIAVWLHTVRTRKEINETQNETYATHIDTMWKRSLPDQLRYANNIYISLLIDFRKFPLWQPQNFLRALNPKSDERRFNRVIQDRELELTEVADKIMADLANFNPQRLEIANRGGIYYSEQMEFLHELLTFNDDQMPIPLGDISRKLYPEKFIFNLYTGRITIKSPTATKFGAVINVKEVLNVPANALKDLLNSDYELVISEAVDFSFGNKTLPEYQYQKYVNSLTDDRRFVDMMGGPKSEPKPEDFGLSQTSILLIRPSLKELSDTLLDINTRIENLGLITHIEDVHLERSFWAMLPGNFAFLKRQQLVAHDDIGRFASLGADKFTAVADCMFGEPVTFFEKHNSGAFPLHFLKNGQSNILITGRGVIERRILGNLIAAQGVRMGMDVVLFDDSGKNKDFANKLKAKYFTELELKILAAELKPKTILLINSITKIVDHPDQDAISDFFDYAANQNTMIIACADFKDNCEALLPNFLTQIFLQGDIEKFADHFDLFEDEIRLIDLLDHDSFYFKHGYDEVVLNFRPSNELVQALIGDAQS